MAKSGGGPAQLDIAADDVPSICRLVVPLDGTDEAESAITPGLWLAKTLDVPIELVTVYNAVRHAWTQQIDEIAGSLDYDNIDVVCVGSGWPGDVIVDTVSEKPGTVLCMATHSRDRLARLVLGSVTEHVLRTVDSPILMMGPHFQPARQPLGYRRLIVGATNDPRDHASLDVARSWATQLGLELELAHIAPPSLRDTGDIERHMSGLAARLNGAGTPTTCTLIRADKPAEGLAALLRERPDAIALLNSHRRVGLARLVLGSVASSLLETSPAPLLLTSHP